MKDKAKGPEAEGLEAEKPEAADSLEAEAGGGGGKKGSATSAQRELQKGGA